jgi:hypothetical protein
MRIVTSTSEDGYETIRAKTYTVLALVAFVAGLFSWQDVMSPTVDAAWWQHLCLGFVTALGTAFCLFLGSLKYPTIHMIFAVCLGGMTVVQIIAAGIDIFQAISGLF